MHHLSYQHIRVSQDEVAGDRPGVYAAVTCIGTSPATAVVMAVGDNGGTVSEARNALSKNMAGIIRFDDQ
jgi:hypothetical protein